MGKMKTGKVVKVIKLKNGKEAKLRYPKFEDWKDLLEYINSLVEENALIIINKKISKKKELEWITKQLKKIETNQMVALVAEVDGKVVGVCDIKKLEYKKSHVGSLGIGVRKEYRGLGIGYNLMKTAIKLAKKELKLKIITLNVFENNKIALKLYKQLGFKVCGRCPKFLKHKGKFWDELIMYKEI